MQFIRKSLIGPKDLRKRRKKYYLFLKSNNCSISPKDNDEKANAKIYSLYKKNKLKYELSYATTPTKMRLLKNGRNRCCFCSRLIVSKNKFGSNSKNFKYISIEHFKEETNYPLNILDWNNLFPCCDECNNTRDSKKINTSISPSSRRFLKEINKNLIFLYDGRIHAHKLSFINDFINTYNLNSNELINQRNVFYHQLINQDFKLLLKLESKDTKKYAIIFMDEFAAIKRYHKNSDLNFKNTTLFKVFDEVINNGE